LHAFIRRNGINESFFPLGAAIIEAVFAAGGAEIVGNQSTGSESIYQKILHVLSPFGSKFH